MSGIGDNDVLTKAGIEIKHCLAGVGNNAQEHLQVTTAFGTRVDLPAFSSFQTSISELEDDPNDQFQTLDCLRDPVQLVKDCPRE